MKTIKEFGLIAVSSVAAGLISRLFSKNPVVTASVAAATGVFVGQVIREKKEIDAIEAEIIEEDSKNFNVEAYQEVRAEVEKKKDNTPVTKQILQTILASVDENSTFSGEKVYIRPFTCNEHDYSVDSLPGETEEEFQENMKALENAKASCTAFDGSIHVLPIRKEGDSGFYYPSLRFMICIPPRQKSGKKYAIDTTPFIKDFILQFQDILEQFYNKYRLRCGLEELQYIQRITLLGHSRPDEVDLEEGLTFCKTVFKPLDKDILESYHENHPNNSDATAFMATDYRGKGGRDRLRSDLQADMFNNYLYFDIRLETFDNYYGRRMSTGCDIPAVIDLLKTLLETEFKCSNIYDEKNRGYFLERIFFHPSGDLGRVYVPFRGNEITISESYISETRPYVEGDEDLTSESESEESE